MPGRFHLYPFKVGEIIHLKKQHPCGGWLWRVERIGADIGMTCTTCNRFMVMPRQKLEKAMKSVQAPEQASAQAQAQTPAQAQGKGSAHALGKGSARVQVQTPAMPRKKTGRTGGTSVL